MTKNKTITFGLSRGEQKRLIEAFNNAVEDTKNMNALEKQINNFNLTYTGRLALNCFLYGRLVERMSTCEHSTPKKGKHEKKARGAKNEA